MYATYIERADEICFSHSIASRNCMTELVNLLIIWTETSVISPQNCKKPLDYLAHHNHSIYCTHWSPVILNFLHACIRHDKFQSAFPPCLRALRELLSCTSRFDGVN